MKSFAHHRGARSSGLVFPGGSRLSGFSLLEVLCAVLILGVALVGITQGITTALQSHKDSELLTKAAVFAAGLMETVKADGTFINGTDEGECGSGLDQYSWQTKISNSDIDGLHQVEVVVSDHGGKPIYSLQTLMFEIPVSKTGDSKTGKDSKSAKEKRRTR